MEYSIIAVNKRQNISYNQTVIASYKFQTNKFDKINICFQRDANFLSFLQANTLRISDLLFWPLYKQLMKLNTMLSKCKQNLQLTHQEEIKQVMHQICLPKLVLFLLGIGSINNI